MPITCMQYLNNLLDIVHVHLFTASPLTSQQVEFIHPRTTTDMMAALGASRLVESAVSCHYNGVSPKIRFRNHSKNKRQKMVIRLDYQSGVLRITEYHQGRPRVALSTYHNVNHFVKVFQFNNV